MALEKIIRLTLINVFFFIVVAAFRVCSAAGAWSYDDHHDDGPSHWEKTFPDCGKAQQSPINIEPSLSSYREIAPMQFEDYDSLPDRYSYRLINNGHTVQLNVERGDMFISNADLRGRYRLAQFHLHWGSTNDQGSEHTLDGHRYPMEIHFVHYNDRYRSIDEALKHSDGLAVIGAFFEIEHERHPTFDQLIEQFCLIKHSGSNASDVPIFPMKTLLPADRRTFYRYNGSLTTPGCKEIVTWTVLRDTIKISQAQLNAFRALGHHSKGGKSDDPLVDNFRPVQPLGSRLVLRNHQVAQRPKVRASAAPAAPAALRVPIGAAVLMFRFFGR